MSFSLRATNNRDAATAATSSHRGQDEDERERDEGGDDEDDEDDDDDDDDDDEDDDGIEFAQQAAVKALVKLPSGRKRAEMTDRKKQLESRRYARFHAK
jgi:hypothetical protein